MVRKGNEKTERKRKEKAGGEGKASRVGVKKGGTKRKSKRRKEQKTIYKK